MNIEILNKDTNAGFYPSEVQAIDFFLDGDFSDGETLYSDIAVSEQILADKAQQPAPSQDFNLN